MQLLMQVSGIRQSQLSFTLKGWKNYLIFGENDRFEVKFSNIFSINAKCGVLAFQSRTIFRNFYDIKGLETTYEDTKVKYSPKIFQI